MKKAIIFFIFSFMLPAHAQPLPPPDFFISDGEPNVLLIIGQDASSRDILLVSSIASRIGSMAYKRKETQSEGVVWESEKLYDYLYHDEDGFLPHLQRFNRGNIALGYTGVGVSLGIGGTHYIADPANFGEYDFIGANSIDGDWDTLIYLASGSFWYWPDDNFFTLEFVEEKKIDRIILKMGHMGNYRLQYGSYDTACARWVWNDIPFLHEGTPSGPPPLTDPSGNILGNPSGTSIKKYFFSPLLTKAVRLLITPTDFSGNPHLLYEFQVYGSPFNVLHKTHYFVDFIKEGDREGVKLASLDFWINGIVPTLFSDFMETRGHSWRTPPNGYSLFDRQINPLRLYRNYLQNENLLFYGNPHNCTLHMRKGEKMDMEGWSVILEDVDLNEGKVALTVENSSFKRKIFMTKRFTKKVAAELFVDASQNDSEREAMYALDSGAKDNVVFLEYHPDLADPLHDSVLNTAMWWHTQNSTSRANAFWNRLSSNPPPPIFPFAVFDGRVLETDRNNFWQKASESLIPPRVELVANGDIDGNFIFVSGGFRMISDFSFSPTELHLKYIIYERNVLAGGALHDYVVRGIVEEADTIFQNHTKKSWWSYHELRSGEKYLFSRVFDLENCDWNIKIGDPRNVGVAVILQRYECSACPTTYDVPGEILDSSSYDEVRGDIFPPYVIDTQENFYPTFEVVEDLDEDGKRDDVVFAIENVFAGIGASGEIYATFNAYALTDYGILRPQCCFFENKENVWDLFIHQDFNPSDIVHEGSLKVSLREPMCVSCEGEGTFYGPERYFRLILEDIIDEKKEEKEIMENHSYTASKFFIERIAITTTIVISNPDPTTLILFDYEVTEKEKSTKNLILFGADNRLTVELRKKNISQIDWDNSEGDMEYLKETWGAHDVLIVAGHDRKAFENGARLLLQYIEGLS